MTPFNSAACIPYNHAHKSQGLEIAFVLTKQPQCRHSRVLCSYNNGEGLHFLDRPLLRQVSRKESQQGIFLTCGPETKQGHMLPIRFQGQNLYLGGKGQKTLKRDAREHAMEEPSNTKICKSHHQVRDLLKSFVKISFNGGR